MKLITKQLIYGKEVTIIADADEVPKHDTYFQLTSVSKGRAFKVQESTITNEGISVKLHEACYHSDTLAQKTNAVNPKDLIGAELELITDQDRIKRIKEQATWC